MPRATRVQADSIAWGEVDGAFPITTVTTKVTFWDCVQAGHTAEECSVTLIASPK